ncbi:MAG: nucleotidyltransferase domain-containing protein [Candidatus Bathyarchaeia archaeon]
MGIIEERRRLREKRILEAKEWASRISFKATVILIGSYARGDFNLWSDVDILVISEEFVGSPVHRLENLDAPPGYQIIALTPKEFKRLIERREPIAMEAIEHGVVLRDDLSIFSNKKYENHI